MTQLIWNNVGERFFETGIDRGVFYKEDASGVAWNGLTAVTESLTGGEAVPYYIDGVKYLNRSAREEFGGTIEAFAYPPAFVEYDGTKELYTGLTVNLQPRKPFGLSYRTKIGNDTQQENYGYKIHIIYNVLAAPSTKAYSTMGSNIDPLNFSWTFTTKPVFVSNGLNYTAHVVIDSTRVSSGLVRAIEGYLYGSSTRTSKLIDLETLIYWFESGGEVLEVKLHTNGLHELVPDGLRDLVTTDNDGLFSLPPDTRLTESPKWGLYTLEP